MKRADSGPGVGVHGPRAGARAGWIRFKSHMKAPTAPTRGPGARLASLAHPHLDARRCGGDALRQLRREEGVGPVVERLGEGMDRDEGDVPLAALDLAYVGRVEAGLRGQLLLRHPPREA